MTGFTRRQWEQIKARDKACVWHGHGCDPDMWVPQHRAGRGMGGDRSKNRLANGIVLCSLMNGLLEADPDLANEARRRGVKISRHADPTRIPVLYEGRGFFFLDDGGGMTPDPDEGQPF